MTTSATGEHGHMHSGTDAPVNPGSGAGYPAVSRFLHWLVAGGIVLQFVLGERAEEAAAGGDLPGQLAALAQHKSIGITVLGLALLRAVWRFIQPPTLSPTSPQEQATASLPWQERLAKIMHVALYVLLFFLPLSGWLMSSASGYSVAWFNLAQLPDLIGPSESAKELLQTLHNAGAKILLVLAIGHILAGLKHWLIDKDMVMGRMGGSVGTLVFVGTVAAGIVFTWPRDRTATPPATTGAAALATPAVAPAPAQNTPATETELATASIAEAQPVIRDAKPPRWKIHPDNSHIRFTAQQAGADFSGEWEVFNADIRFSANNLDNSSATVTIDASMLQTNDEERDEILSGLDWFDSENYASVVFTADEFSTTDVGFSTQATLQIRGASFPVEFNFSVASDQGFQTLTGTSRLDRLALNLGTIDWLDTEWVGQFVEVEVQVEGDTYGDENDGGGASGRDQN